MHEAMLAVLDEWYSHIESTVQTPVDLIGIVDCLCLILKKMLICGYIRNILQHFSFYILLNSLYQPEIFIFLSYSIENCI